MKIRTLFMGSDAFALPMLDILVEHDGVDFIGVFTQPDRRQGRGMKVQANAIKQWAQERRIPVYQPNKIGEEEYALLREKGCELILVAAYGHILKDALLRIPRLGIFNLHTSLLPAYRGASPIQTAIAGGEATTGVTLMRMERAMDAGPIVDREPIPIGPDDDSPTIYGKAGAACVPLLKRSLTAMLNGTIPLTPQDSDKASYCRRLNKDDGALDFKAPALVLYNRIRALCPWPGCFVHYAGVHLKLGSAVFENEKANALPGCILGLRDEGLAVATGQGVLVLKSLQRPGGKMLAARTFLDGFDLPVGTQLTSQPMPSLLVNR